MRCDVRHAEIVRLIPPHRTKVLQGFLGWYVSHVLKSCISTFSSLFHLQHLHFWQEDEASGFVMLVY